jgi:CTP:phosphocholine cytidylyltransferase-like protein
LGWLQKEFERIKERYEKEISNGDYENFNEVWKYFEWD